MVAPLICAPGHLTRFSPPKLAVAFLGVLLGLLTLGIRRGCSPSTTTAHRPWLWPLFLGWGAISLGWSADADSGLIPWLLWLLAWLWVVLLGRLPPEQSGTCSREALRRHLAWAWVAATGCLDQGVEALAIRARARRLRVATRPPRAAWRSWRCCKPAARSDWGCIR